MLRKVHLHGALGAEFGTIWTLDIASPAEAVRALCALVPAIRERISSGSYRIFRGDIARAKTLGEDDLRLSLAGEVKDVHFVPVVAGAGGRAGQIGKIVAGAILIAVSFYIPPAGVLGYGLISGGMVFGLGASILLAGVSGMLARQQKASARAEVENEESALFSGSANNTSPGAAIPVVAGIFEVGSVVASSAIHVEDRVVLET